MEILTVLLRTLLFYFIIALVYRFMGKREVGELSIMDLIVSILIAELAAIAIDKHEESLLITIIPICVLVIIQIIVAKISLKSTNIREKIEGEPSVIINRGKINFKEMLKQRYNLDDLLVQLRDKGYRSIEEVEYAVLESSGTLSVFPYDTGKSPLPLPIILDGDIQDDTIRHLKKNRKWVYDFLDKKDIKIQDVFFAFYKDKNIFIIKNDDLL